MLVQYSTATRTLRAQQIEIAVTGASNGTLVVYTGTIPTSMSPTLPGDSLALATYVLPPNFLTTNASAVTSIVGGPWNFTGDAGLTQAWDATYFIFWSDLGVPEVLGDVTVTGGGGTMQLSSVSIAALQAVSITAVSLPEPNA